MYQASFLVSGWETAATLREYLFPYTIACELEVISSTGAVSVMV